MNRGLPLDAIVNGNLVRITTRKRNMGEWSDYVINHAGYKMRHRQVAPGKTEVALEHREVMEHTLGRKLLPEENVHHINGDRLDNRIENLELWNKAQPSGQRIEDKVNWATHILALYAPDMLK